MSFVSCTNFGDVYMEELNLLARTYYRAIIDIRYFGWVGGIYLLFTALFAGSVIYLNFNYGPKNFSAVLILIAALFGVAARKQYDRNLVVYLSHYTLLDSDKVEHHKAVYLQSLVSHVADSLYDAMLSFKDIRETYSGEYNLFSQNEWARFYKFIYDPESKNRILSLIIYLISLVGLITVTKSDSSEVFYELINTLDFDSIRKGFFWLVFIIVLLYAIVVVPARFVYKYVIMPAMLQFSSMDTLSKFFIFELNRYAHFESRINRIS